MSAVGRIHAHIQAQGSLENTTDCILQLKAMSRLPNKRHIHNPEIEDAGTMPRTTSSTAGSRLSIPDKRSENEVYSSMAALIKGLTRTVSSLDVNPLSKVISSINVNGSDAKIARSP